MFDSRLKNLCLRQEAESEGWIEEKDRWQTALEKYRDKMEVSHGGEGKFIKISRFS